MSRILAALALLAAGPALAQQDEAPPPPDIPAEVEIMEGLAGEGEFEPEVTIVRRDDAVVEEYRINGHTLVTQSDRQGLGHAIWLTRDEVQDAELLIVLGDTICDYNLKKVIQKPVSQIAVRKVDDPRLFGVAELDEEDRVLRVVEKPIIPRSNMAMVGVYYIKESEALFQALETHIGKGKREDGEYHLTVALQLMIEKGIPFEAFRVNNWFDCGKKESLLETNATLLKNMSPTTQPALHRFGSSVIIPPVSIAEGCQIHHSIIGPHVSIGENTHIESSIIKDSIIGSFTELEEVVLHSSIIGSDATIRGLSQSLNIGDNTEIDLG